MISDESDRFNPRDPKPADAGKPSKSAKRREARQLATQALYQWHMAKASLNEIEAQFRVDNDFSDVDGAYFREILHGVPASKTEIDTALKPCLDRAIDAGRLSGTHHQGRWVDVGTPARLAWLDAELTSQGSAGTP